MNDEQARLFELQTFLRNLGRKFPPGLQGIRIQNSAHAIPRRLPIVRLALHAF
jgi:hypothetical protein